MCTDRPHRVSNPLSPSFATADPNDSTEEYPLRSIRTASTGLTMRSVGGSFMILPRGYHGARAPGSEDYCRHEIDRGYLVTTRLSRAS
jgi:hypothetical protein